MDHGRTALFHGCRYALARGPRPDGIYGEARPRHQIDMGLDLVIVNLEALYLMASRFKERRFRLEDGIFPTSFLISVMDAEDAHRVLHVG
jgi:hypothetical protein